MPFQVEDLEAAQGRDSRAVVKKHVKYGMGVWFHGSRSLVLVAMCGWSHVSARNLGSWDVVMSWTDKQVLSCIPGAVRVVAWLSYRRSHS